VQQICIHATLNLENPGHRLDNMAHQAGARSLSIQHDRQWRCICLDTLQRSERQPGGPPYLYCGPPACRATGGRLYLDMGFLLTALLVPHLLASDSRRWEVVLDDILAKSREPVAEAPVPVIPAPALDPVVAGFVRYFQGRGQSHYRASLARLQKYRPMIDRVFREEGLPPELVWVGLVESGYDPQARSPKDALGIWQLMPATAAAFGLSSNERTHPEKSTRAAASYLKSLYTGLGEWALTLAAYNAGERRVRDAIERAGTRDFRRLSASGLLPRETQAYVPAVLAAQFLGQGTGGPGESPAYADTATHTARIAVAPFSLSR